MDLIDRYLERIGHANSVPPTETTLAALHAAHARSIPFENLDIHLGRPISGDIARIADKLVLRKRGGYCFEQNTLFMSILDRLGFRVRPHLGRVTFGAKSPRPRGHLTLLVELRSQVLMADVGFGGHGLIEPVPFETGRIHKSGGDAYRLQPAETGGWEIELLRDGDWTSLYWFDRAPCYPVDIDIVNFYHSHAPESFFFQNRVIALAERDCRKTLTNGALRITRGKVVESREITDGEPYYAVLRDEFGIVLAEEEWRHLRALPQNA